MYFPNMYLPVFKYNSGRAFLYRDNSNRVVIPIYKNGSTSITKWTSTNPIPIEKTFCNKLNKDCPYKATFFLRDPVSRFISGLRTVGIERFLDCPKNITDRILDIIFNVFFIDKHLLPQLFTLEIYCKYAPNSTFKFHSYKNINSVLGINKVENATDPYSTKKLIDCISRDVSLWENKIKKAYYIDQIMWDEFVGETLTLHQIQERIDRESKFFKDHNV